MRAVVPRAAEVEVLERHPVVVRLSRLLRRQATVQKSDPEAAVRHRAGRCDVAVVLVGEDLAAVEDHHGSAVDIVHVALDIAVFDIDSSLSSAPESILVADHAAVVERQAVSGHGKGRSLRMHILAGLLPDVLVRVQESDVHSREIVRINDRALLGTRGVAAGVVVVPENRGLRILAQQDHVVLAGGQMQLLIIASRTDPDDPPPAVEMLGHGIESRRDCGVVAGTVRADHFHDIAGLRTSCAQQHRRQQGRCLLDQLYHRSEKKREAAPFTASPVQPYYLKTKLYCWRKPYPFVSPEFCRSL